MRLRGCICILLISHCTFPVFGQTQPVPAQPGAGSALKILVLEGEDGKNSIKARVGIPILVEIQDAEGRPLPGAQVIFQLPASGPSGSFPGGSLTQRTVANARGQAATSGFVPNNLEGRLNVRVSASSGALGATQVLSQTNVAMAAGAKGGGSKKTLWILVAVAVVGGVVGGVVGRGSSSTASTPANTSNVVLVPGPVTVGGPR